MLLLALSTLGCSDLFEPTVVTELSAMTHPCGSYVVLAGVDNLRGQDVELLLDGTLLQSWPDALGDHRWTFDSDAPLQQDGTLTLRVSGMEGQPTGRRDFQLVRPSLPVLANLRPTNAVFRPGTPPRFDLWISSPCSLDGLTWRAVSPEWSSSGPVAASLTTLELPPHGVGVHMLQVDVTDLRGVVSQAQARFEVGEGTDIDADGDGWPATQDCNDTDPGAHPAGTERSEPNGIDDNCDGRIDEGTVAYDDDGDGYAERTGDCNDRDDRVHPGASEVANCRDEDCDGQVDEGLVLPQQDDTFEQPEGAPYAFEGMRRRFEADLRLVTRDRSDREAFRFWSDDGDWDTWGIEVVATRMPQDAVYDVQLVREDGGATVATGQLAADGEMVSASGAAFRNDSGYYRLVVVPARVQRDWCPLELSILSR